MNDEVQRALNYVDAHDDRASWTTYVAMHAARILAHRVREQEELVTDQLEAIDTLVAERDSKHDKIVHLRKLLLWMRLDSQGEYGIGDALQRRESLEKLYRQVDAELTQEDSDG